MKVERILAFIVIGTILLCTFALIWYQHVYTLERYIIPADFRVEGRVAGLTTDTDALHFGTVPPAGTSQRRMIITPAHDSRLVIRTDGNASPYLYLNNNNIKTKAGNQTTIIFTVALPANISTGNYTADVKFTFYR